MKTSLDDVYETFELLDDWTDRYGFLIELGGELPPMPEELKVPEHKVKGCMSQVWLVGVPKDGTIDFLADSDAHIVRGLVALLLMIYGGKTPAEIAATDHQAVLARLGLDKHLSPGRSNGLHSMVKRVKELAAAVDASA
ncbi:MAG TPA: SufE family protein [Polyangiaceae bacterium LLY-WYZ-15_(1-7)]|nr:cysteine desulfuration protein SufE [Myxococcales bacterium]MAT25795.1 cysteine desulfuration protein SufE [Sandaracinus sp.]HJK95378.1 SufE family protein [Polyangiaceae bacterium LLY-WYZ-15_(1-7)]MBJ70723.1 cysteine desulfuration protein SufE [Sandaracinus sp.]HJL04378.1 SufE family protein [Polyangiaceae bacterium LLY-WYZ-15_(1-7)]